MMSDALQSKRRPLLSPVARPRYDSTQPNARFHSEMMANGAERVTGTSQFVNLKCEVYSCNDVLPENQMPLMPYRLMFFFLAAAVSVLTFCLPLYLKGIGLNAAQVGVVLFFLPVGGFAGGAMTPVLTKWVMKPTTAIIIYPLLYLSFVSTIALVNPLPLFETCQHTHRASLNESHRKRMLTADDRTTIHAQTGFWFPLAAFSCIVFCANFCAIGTDTLIHGITMRYLRKDTSKTYGEIRAWTSMGYAVAGMASGLIVQLTVKTERVCEHVMHTSDYYYIMYIFFTFAAVTVLCAKTFFASPSNETSNGEEKTASPDSLGVYHILCTVKNITWIFVLFARSAFIAVTQGFLFWHLENIGASPALIGLANFTPNATEFPMFFVVPKLIQKFGHAKLLLVGISSYVLRFVVYTVIINPVVILPVEILEGLMFSCVWTSVVTFLSDQVPSQSQTSIQGIIQATTMLGISCGYPISGALTYFLGAPAMFLVFAGAAAVTLAVLVIEELFNP